MSRFFNGVAFLLFATNVHGQSNLVQNGSFESYVAIPYSVPPWNPAPSLNLKWPNAPSGQNYANILTLSQDVHTVAGAFYSLSFYAAADLLVNPVGTIEVSWGGKTLPPFATIPHAYDPNRNRSDQIVWERFTVEGLIATSDRMPLGFAVIQNSQIFIDDIRLLEVPEPCCSASAQVFASE